MYHSPAENCCACSGVQRGFALDRGLDRTALGAKPDHRRTVLAGRRRSVEMGHGGRPRQPAVAEGPGQHSRPRIIGQFGRPGGGCLPRRHPCGSRTRKRAGRARARADGRYPEGPLRAQGIGINRPADGRSRRRAPLSHDDVLRFGFDGDRGPAGRSDTYLLLVEGRSASDRVDRPAVVAERDSHSFYPAPAPKLLSPDLCQGKCARGDEHLAEALSNHRARLAFRGVRPGRGVPFRWPVLRVTAPAGPRHLSARRASV
jgi:hypothetical protein